MKNINFNFILVFPDGKAINQHTVISNQYKITDKKTLCKVIKSAWRKHTGLCSFTEWAEKGNNPDNLFNNFYLNMDGKSIDLHNLFQQYLPFKIA